MIKKASPSDFPPSLNAATGLRAQQAFSEFGKRLLLHKVRRRCTGFEEETEPRMFSENGRGSKKRQVSKKRFLNG